MIAIINGYVMTMNDITFTQGTILIDKGKVIAVGMSGDIPIPNDVQVIDVQGQLVSPGLIDVHTHIGIDEEGIGWEGDDYNESSEPVTPHVRAMDGINPFDQGFSDAAGAGVTTVQVLPGSANVIGGLMCCLKVKPGSIVEEMLILHPSGLKIAFGENPKKLHGKAGRAPQTRMGIAALLREELIKAKNYLLKRAEGRDVDFDLRMEALVLALKKEIPVRAHAHRADDIITAIRIAKEFDLDLSIEHTTEGHKIAKHLKTPGVSIAVGPTLSSRSKVELKNKDWQTYAVLAKENIPFAISTDHPVLPIEHLPTSAGLAMKAGLEEEEAWKSITINAARHLRLDHRVGSIQVGKDADLVVWSSHPLTSHGEALITMVEGEITHQSPRFTIK
jgi:imidazolonepropionase-like amidohydrolase